MFFIFLLKCFKSFTPAFVQVASLPNNKHGKQNSAFFQDSHKPLMLRINGYIKFPEISLGGIRFLPDDWEITNS